MVKHRERDWHQTKTRPDQEATDIHSTPHLPPLLEARKWISISGGLISLIMVHSPLSGPGVNIAGWCQDANTDQSQGDGSWWLPICQSRDGRFADTITVNSITVALCFYPEALRVCWHVLVSAFVCMHLFQLSVADNLSDGIVLCVMYCSLTSLMPFAWKLEELE